MNWDFQRWESYLRSESIANNQLGSYVKFLIVWLMENTPSYITSQVKKCLETSKPKIK